MNSFTLPAFAKINLGLRVLRKRDDGFHDLETVFLRIGWKDELTFEFELSGPGLQHGSSKNEIDAPLGLSTGLSIEHSIGLSMTSSNPNLPVDDSNLCIRAAKAYLAACSQIAVGTRLLTPKAPHQNVTLHLEKNIPFGAGMGGGSSDAATVLRAMEKSDLLPALSAETLHAVASHLGSDVPFFLSSPTAFGSGRGEVLEEMAFPRQLEGTWMVVGVPDDRVSTPDAFRHIVPNDSREADLRKLVEQLPLESWAGAITNDFEDSVFATYPSILGLKEAFYDAGAVFSLMSGSGSSVFGVFTSEESDTAALAKLKHRWPSYAYWIGASNAGL